MHKKLVKKLLLFFLFIISLLSFSSCKFPELNVRIFFDLEECNYMLYTNNADVKIYDTPIKDKYLKKIEYKDFFACRYSSDELTFEIFSYEFADSASSDEYFENVTGKNNELKENFSDVSGAFYYRRIVISDNKAYTIYSKPADSDKVIEFLENMFSEEILT